MIDLSETTLTMLTLGSIITNNSICLEITENFGNLAKVQKLKTTGTQLVGSYGNALTGMSAVVVGLGILCIIFYLYGLVRLRKNKIVWLFILFSVFIGIASAGLDLYLVERYGEISSLESDPAKPITGENYKLRGPFGLAVVSMASISTGFAGISIFWWIALFVKSFKSG